jgi:2-(1,2-epoxy-1,2-dihydrophenyl)acetyl-CoA isomerase
MIVEESPLRTTLKAGVMTIELHRPDALNALTTDVGERLVAALYDAADPAVRCVLITGAGRAFCAGADLRSFGGALLPSGAPDLAHALRTCFNRPVRQIRDLEKPVVAAVNGPAVGIGASYALACDVVLAAQSAYLLMPFTTIGLVPDGGASCLVPARAGFGRFNALSIGGRRVGATEAERWGLVDGVVDDKALLATARAEAERLAAGPTAAFAACKQMVNEQALPGLDVALELEAELQGVRAESPEFAAALTRFRSADR